MNRSKIYISTKSIANAMQYDTTEMQFRNVELHGCVF